MDMRFIYIELYKVATRAFKNYVYSTLRSLFVSLFLIILSVLFRLSSFLWRTNSPCSATYCLQCLRKEQLQQLCK